MTNDLDKLLDEARGPETFDERFERTGGTGCPAPGQKDPELLAERRAFYAAHPWPAAERAIEERRGTGLFARIRFWIMDLGWAQAAGVAATVLVVAGTVALLDGRRAEVLDEPGVRTKGTVKPAEAKIARDEDVAVSIHGAALAAAPDGYRAGDAVWFSYTSLDLPWLVLGSIDGRGEVSIYYPENAEQSLSIVPGRNVRLPDSVILDDYVGQERFFAVFSAEPVLVERVRAAASSTLNMAGGTERMGRLPLGDTAQASFVIRKVAD